MVTHCVFTMLSNHALILLFLRGHPGYIPIDQHVKDL